MKKRRLVFKRKRKPEVVVDNTPESRPFVPRSGAWLYSYRDIITTKTSHQLGAQPQYHWPVP